MLIPLYQVDAFAGALFRGNPAAVCPLERWLRDETLQAIAAENNLSETAYYVRENGRLRLRWFTPTVEIALCGHATLAAAHVMMDLRREETGLEIRFDSRSGELSVARENDLYVLDFPSRPPVESGDDATLFEALGSRPSAFLRTGDCFCVYETEEQIRALAPDMTKLAAVDCRGVIVTAPGKDCDFVSRFFAPRAGIPESVSLYDDWSDLKEERVRFDGTIVDWADAVDPAWLATDHTYHSGATKRDVTQPCWVLVAHMFNHQAHHRGQVHCMLTQAGAKPSDTDLPFLPE